MGVSEDVIELAEGLDAESSLLRAPGGISREERAVLAGMIMERLEEEGLTKERCWLKGRLIRGGSSSGPGWPYSEGAFPYKWDFADGTLSGGRPGSGIVNRRVENGVLKFSAEKNASFSFYPCDLFAIGESGQKVDASKRGGTTGFLEKSVTGTIQAVSMANAFSAGAGKTEPISTCFPDMESDGVAIYSLSGTHGEWQYSTDGGLTWNNTGEVSEKQALLLGTHDTIRFSTGAAITDSAFLEWGNMNPENAGLLFGYNRGEYPAPPISSIAIRMRQSLRESTWYASIKRLQADRETGKQVFNTTPVTLTGTDWQIITIPFDTRRYGALHPPFTGVRIATATTGNEIEIDWVEPRGESRNCYRKTITIPSKARWAKASMSAGFFRLLVNGKVAAESPPSSKAQAIWNFELDPELFKEGENVIGLESSIWWAGMVLLDAALVCVDGTYIRFDSDSTWQYKTNWTEEDAPWKELWTRTDSEKTDAWRNVFEGHGTVEQPENDPFKFWFNPSWKGRLMVKPADSPVLRQGYGGQARQPVFSAREEVALRIAVPEKKGETPELSWKLFDQMGDGFHAYDTLVKEGKLELETGDRRQETGDRGQEAGNQKSKIENRKFNDLVATLSFPAGELKHNVAYALELKLDINGQETEKYRYNFVICGPVEQPIVVNPTNYTDGMDLKLVWELDAADKTLVPTVPLETPKVEREEEILGLEERKEPEPEKGWAWNADFISCNGIGAPVPSTVIETPLGRFRRTDIEKNNVSSAGGGPASYVSFKYTIENPGSAHIAIAEYPSDTVRCQEMRLDEAFPAGTSGHGGGGSTTVLGNHSALIGYLSPLQHKILHHNAVFFPSEKTGTVTFYSIGGTRDLWKPEHAARVGRIWIYEILNDIPMRKIEDAPGKRKWLGQQHEAGPRQVMQSCLASPVHSYFRTRLIASESPIFYRNWLITVINQIKRMRFAGETAFYSGQFMYTKPLYPSKYSDATAFGHDYSGSLTDYGALMAKMFAENDLALYSGIEMCGIHRLQLGCSDDDVARGVDTLSQVTKNGKQWTFLGRGGIYPNWIRPEVRKYFETVMRELIDLYSSEKGWKGIQIQVNEVLGPTWADEFCSDPWFSSYDDWTIALFERETGIKLPSGLSIPSDKSDLSDKSDAPDKQRFQKRYDWLMANAKAEWTKWRADKMTELYQWLADELKKARPDLELVFFPQSMSFIVPEIGEKPDDALPSIFDYSRRGGMDLEYIKESPDMHLAMNVQCAVDANGLLTGRHSTKSRYWSRTDRFITPFSNDGKSGITVRYNWYEAQPSSPPGWVWDYSGTETWMWAENKYFGDYWVNIFIRSNPSFMLHSLMDCTVWMGRELEMSRFAQAFRTLPAAEYTRLKDNSRDKNVWIQTALCNGDVYGYIANAQWWDINADIKFRPGAQAMDLIEPETITDGTWNVDLPPYTIRTFRVKGIDSHDVIESCSAVVSEQGRQATEKLLTDYRKFYSANTAKLAETGDKTALEEMMDKAENFLKQGEYAEAFDTMMLFPAVSNIVLEPDPETGWGKGFVIQFK